MYDTKHGQQYTKHGYMKKGRLVLILYIIIYIFIYIYIWTHDTYIKVLGCKTRNNSSLMYISIKKLLLIWLKQVL